MDQLAQLDELVESDILEALGENPPTQTQENTTISSSDEIQIDIQDLEEEEAIAKNDDTATNNEETKEEASEELVTANPTKIETNINSDDLASLLNQLLAHKTIEITIKIKD